MNDEHMLALVLAGVGALGVGALAVMSRSPAPPSRWYELHWPRDVPDDGVTAFLRSVSADRQRNVVVLEVVAHGGKLSYRLGLPEGPAAGTLAALRSFVPGVTAQLIRHSIVSAPRVTWEVQLSSLHRPIRLDSAEQVARAIITALATADDETVILQWLLGPRRAPQAIMRKVRRPADGWVTAVRDVVYGPVLLDNDGRRALQLKVGDAGFRAIGRIGIAAGTDVGAQLLAKRLLGALRQAESPGLNIALKRGRNADIAAAVSSNRWPLALNVRELTALAAWPLGDGALPGVRGSGSTPLRRPDDEPSKDRVVGRSTYPGDDRPLTLSPTDALQHLHVLGPTGVGKSTLLLNLITADIAAGRGVVVVDPKGDLVEDVLARIPDRRRDDVVVLDPADEARPVGLNVLRGGDRSAELIADQVLAVFHGLYRDNWGPRTQDILHASLLTLAGRSGMTLCALPVLLSNQGFRSRVVAGVEDQIALRPFWHWFDTLSEGERQQAIAPVMNKLRAFLLRPRMRAVIGQSEPAFDLSDVFRHRRIVLVSLAKGLLGPEAAALLGSLVIAQLWQAALGRVRIDAGKRHPVMVYVDEFQDYLHLPTDLADVLAQARGLGVGLTLAHQHLAQLPTAMRSAVLANARSRVCFQLSADDARTIAATAPELTVDDLQQLPRFEAYASLVNEGSATRYASLRTDAPREPSIDSTTVREHSRQRYGTRIADIEAELKVLISGGDRASDRPVGRRRRQ